MSLTKEQIEALLASGGGTYIYEDIALVDAWLEQYQPFYGNRQNLADAMGISVDRLQRVLNVVRSQEFVDAFGWTIPWVRKGRGERAWVRAESMEQFEELNHGNKIKKKELKNTLAKFRATVQEQVEVTKDDQVKHALAVTAVATVDYLALLMGNIVLNEEAA